MKRGIPKSAVKILVLAAIILSIISWVIISLGRMVSSCEYLRIKEVMTNNREAVDLGYLKGRNTFAIDLNKESRYILENYPGYSRVRVIRVFPNRLFVDFKPRVPLAYVRLYKYFYVDQDAVLVDAGYSGQNMDLPLIVGLETRIFGPRSGKKYDIKELRLALDIIKGFAKYKPLAEYKIRKVDVSSPDNASLFIVPAQALPAGRQAQVPESNIKPVSLPAAIEIKLGQTDVAEKMDILSSVFAQAKNDLSRIVYIDLRFKEPVLKLKDAKKQ